MPLAFLCGCWTATAQTSEHSEAEWQVKAAYLFKISGYVEWPPAAFKSAESPLQIGVLDADELAYYLSGIVAGRTTQGRSVNVLKLKRGDSLTGLGILFIGRSDAGQLAQILSTIKGQPTLIVTDMDEGLTLGSMVNFVLVDGKVRFELAPKTATLSNLMISSQLFAVAHRVVQNPS
ncbi:MAG: hypothetical protein JWM03_985 [Rhodocyclales bacterium]|nr:hypothetical protein [Rhodocyclales bacterium]